MDRKPSAVGSFYSADEKILRDNLASLFARAVPKKIDRVRAIIVPHAGYVFSGTVAASGYKQIEKDAYFENVFIIASSHHSAANLVSTYCSGNYLTPLGVSEVNPELTAKLVKETDFIRYLPEADAPEHSVEVQLPFLKYWLNASCKIVPFIICTWNVEVINDFSKVLEPYFNEKNLFVISSDFSHYPAYDDAVSVDKETVDAILSNSRTNLLNMLLKHNHSGIRHLETDLCGWTAVMTLLNITEGKSNLSFQQVDYANSGDSKYGDKMNVVGYSAIVVSEEISDRGVTFSAKEQKTLLDIAREAIWSVLHPKEKLKVVADDFTENLLTKCGAFVTLTKNGKLRGCVGRFGSSLPLFEVVVEMAYAAAFEDNRFPPLTAEELEEVHIEISVLTPLHKIASAEEIVLGKHGIYIRKGMISGTFLPQVATETNWTLEEFLGHCSRDKAGLGWDGWRDAELFTYEAIIIRE